MLSLDFEKMVAAGNDFIVVDNRNKAIQGNFKAKSKFICDRKLGAGADGLLLLEKSSTADVRMRIFNPDGSEADMCGNGVRCLSMFAYQKKITGSTHKVQTEAGIIESKIRGNKVKSRLTNPKDLKMGLSVKTSFKLEQAHFINTGVPHAVVVEKAIVTANVFSRGRELRRHAFFGPKGTNVNFMCLEKRNRIRVRTYERGVEAETLACGTGSTASALIASLIYGLNSPVEVLTSGGEKLKIYFNKSGEIFSNVYLEGIVRSTFQGRIRI